MAKLNHVADAVLVALALASTAFWGTGGHKGHSVKSAEAITALECASNRGFCSFSTAWCMGPLYNNSRCTTGQGTDFTDCCPR